MDDHARRRVGRRAGFGDALAQLSGARLAVSGRGAGRSRPHRLRSDHRRRLRAWADACLQRAAAWLRRAGAGLRLRRLAARARHRRPAAPRHGSRRGALRAADARDAGAPRHEWRRHQHKHADAGRTGDLHARIALGAGAILVALDMRSPSSVLRIGSLAAGVVSVAFVVAWHFAAQPALHRRVDRAASPSSTCCSSPICCRRSPLAPWRSTRRGKASQMVFGDARPARRRARLRL